MVITTILLLRKVSSEHIYLEFTSRQWLHAKKGFHFLRNFKLFAMAIKVIDEGVGFRGL